MTAILTATAVIAGLTAPVAAKTLRSYQDDRFGTAAAVPPDWRRLPPDERWHDPLAAVVPRSLMPRFRSSC
jgi:hypothetical protein